MDSKEGFIRFTEIILGLACLIGVNASNTYIKTLYEVLKKWGFTIEDVESACDQILKTHTYSTLPKAAEFWMAKQDNLPKIEDKAIMEARKILDHLHRYGSGKSPKFSDPITKKLMVGQWSYNKWGSTIIQEEEHWWIKEFVREYLAYSDIDRVEAIGNNKVNNLIEGMFERLPK